MYIEIKEVKCEFSKRIKIRKKLSQNDLAVKVGVTPKYISFIENGERNPSQHIADKIAKVLGKTVDEIFLP